MEIARGASGLGHAVALTADSGYFWFFDPDNLELVVKTLDGCGVDGHFWFFAAGLTNLEVTITVTDRTTGEMKTYRNPARTPPLRPSSTRPPSRAARRSRCSSRSPGTSSRPAGRTALRSGSLAGVTYRITFRSIDVEHGISSIPVLGIPGERRHSRQATTSSRSRPTPAPARPLQLRLHARLRRWATAECSARSRSSRRLVGPLHRRGGRLSHRANRQLTGFLLLCRL